MNLAELKWKMDRLRVEHENNIAINVIPPDGEEDDDEFVPPLRPRRKMSTPLAALPGASDRLLGMPSKEVTVNLEGHHEIRITNLVSYR